MKNDAQKFFAFWVLVLVGVALVIWGYLAPFL